MRKLQEGCQSVIITCRLAENTLKNLEAVRGGKRKTHFIREAIELAIEEKIQKEKVLN